MGMYDDVEGVPGGMFSGPAPSWDPNWSPLPLALGGPMPSDVVVLPDGSRIADSNAGGGYMRSPVADLGPAALAGRQTGITYGQLFENPYAARGATLYMVGRLGHALGHGGTFDYQREGNSLTGFTQYPHYRGVSNVNVGLFCQQAGFTLDETLKIAGTFAQFKSGNADPVQPHGLDKVTADYIKRGFEIGASGMFDPKLPAEP